MLTDEHIGLAKETMADLRKADNKAQLTRWAFLDLPSNTIVERKNYVCVAGLNVSRFWRKPEAILLFPFNGESPKNSRAGGEALEGGPLSRLWLEFLLGDQTPFPDVVPYIANRDDIDGINEEHGFIFSPGYLEVGSGQMRGFLIASRFAQEFHDRCSNWLILTANLKIDPLLAWVLVSSYSFGEGWVLSHINYADHSVFYEPHGMYLPNLYRRKFPYDKPLSKGTLLYCTDALYKKSMENPSYAAFHNGWSLPKEEKARLLYLGVESGQNAVEAATEMTSSLERLYKEEPYYAAA